MSAPPRPVPAPWPHRWIATMLAPEALGIAAVVGGVAVVVQRTVPTVCAAAALLAAAYLHRLLALARVSADQRVPPLTPGAAFRRDLPRCLGSVAARAAGVVVLGLLAGARPAVAVPLGIAIGFAAGWVQLTRQRAIVLTFRDEPDRELL